MKHLSTLLTATIIIILGLLVIKSFDIYYPVQIVTTNRSSELSVVGEGKIDVVPDNAFVDLGVTVNEAKQVADAQKTISETNNKIIDSLRQLGIKKEDIKTSNYSIYPNYVYSGSTNSINGYNGNVTITVKVVKTENVSKVIELALAAGANQVQGTRFEIGDPAKYREEARTKAIENAKQQANKMATDLGIKLGKIVNIVESTPDTINYPVFKDAAMSARPAGGGGGTAIEAGSQTVSSVVTLYFEKK